jgi:hypothetical protein
MLLFLVWSYRRCISVECCLDTECHRLLSYFLQHALLSDLCALKTVLHWKACYSNNYIQITSFRATSQCFVLN